MSRKLASESHRYLNNDFRQQKSLNAVVKGDSVPDSILRGRAALEEAENHIKLFEEYMKQSSQENDSYEEVNDEGSFYHSSLPLNNSNDGLPYFQPSDPGKVDFEYDRYNVGLDLVSNMVKEEKERHKRDSKIDLAHVKKDFLLSNPLSVNEVKSRSDVKLKRKCSFDPKNLSVAKRAIVKEAIDPEDIALKELEQYKKSQFKARPLPGGNFVRNNPYALTKAALGKVSKVNPNGKTIDLSLLNQTTRKDASALLDRSTQLSQHKQFSSTNLSDEEKDTRIKETKKKAMYKDIYNKIGVINSKDFNEAQLESISQDEQDLAILHKQISKLQAELNLKRIQCIKTIEKIDNQDGNIVSITGESTYPNSTFDNETEFDSPLGKFGQDGFSSDKTAKSSNTSKHQEINNHKSIKNDPNVIGKDPSSLYERHNLWLQKIEVKRKEAKEKEERELIKDVTGKPNLHGAQESWLKAKQQHDGLIDEMKSKESSRKSEKELKERLIREKQVAEINKLKSMTREKNKTRKRGIDKKMQAEYVDKLARAGAKPKIEFKATSERIFTQSRSIDEEEQNEKTNRNKDIDSNKDKDISFADMGDKEFAKMIRNLKAKASKGKHTVFETREDSSGFQEGLCKDNNTNEVKPILDCGEIDVNKRDHEKEQKINCFASSTAQAKILAEMSDIKLESYQKKDDAKMDPATFEQQCDLVINQSFSFPYERYEAGEIPFFDRSSSTEIGRFRVRDARDFHTDSLRRIPVPFETSSSSDGVMFLVGRANNHQKLESQEVVTILFNRTHFDDISAAEWWQLNRSQII